MPGNVKLGSSNEPDPDPMPYLAVSNDTKRRAFEISNLTRIEIMDFVTPSKSMVKKVGCRLSHPLAMWGNSRNLGPYFSQSAWS